MTSRLFSLIAVLVSLSLAPAAAHGQGAVAPPGNSAVDEYVETIPSADGNKRPSAGKGGSSGASSLPASTRKKLEAAGRDGQAVLALSNSGDAAPASAGSGAVGKGRKANGGGGDSGKGA